MNHIVKSYDRDLEEVLGEVTAMGRLVREQLVKAADALEKLDADEARSVTVSYTHLTLPTKLEV